MASKQAEQCSTADWQPQSLYLCHLGLEQGASLPILGKQVGVNVGCRWVNADQRRLRRTPCSM